MEQPKKDKSKVLYDAVSKDYDLGTYEEFKTKLQDDTKREAFYNGVGKEYSLGSYKEFEGKLDPLLKKKTLGEPSSENQELALDQEAENGLSVTLKDNKHELNTGNKFKEHNQIARDNISNNPSNIKLENGNEIPEFTPKTLSEKEQIESRIRKEHIDIAKKGFKDAVTFTEDDKQELEKRVKDEETIGFWDNIKQGAISTANIVKQVGTLGFGDTIENPTKTPFQSEIKEVKKEALRKKEKLDESEIKERAKALYKEKQEDFIYTDKANKFLEDLPTETRTTLKIESSGVIDGLSLKNKKRMTINSALEINLKENTEELKRLEDLFRDNPDISEEDINAYNSLKTESIDTYNQINKNYEHLIKNQEDLLSAEKEYDLFKRNYKNAFLGNTILTTIDLGVGMVDFGNHLVNASSELSSLNTKTLSALGIDPKNAIDTKKIRDDLKLDRDLGRKHIESVESVGGFVNYMSDLVANQLPILAITSTGAGGLVTLGASSTGQKFAEMSDENNNLISPKNYTPLQMIGAPLLHGTAEAIFELPTLSILNKGKRVLNAAIKESPGLFKQSATQKGKDLFKDFLKENLAEQGTNIIQNATNIYALGKEGHIMDNALDILKDTSALTGFLQVTPHLAGAALKPFQSKDQLKTLEVNSSKMTELYKHLETENITDTEKKVIESEIIKLNKESSIIMNKTIGDVTNMSESQHKEILKINTEAGELRKQAEDVYVNGTTSDKEGLIKIINDKYNALQDKRISIINNETKESTPSKTEVPLKTDINNISLRSSDLIIENNPESKPNQIKESNDNIVSQNINDSIPNSNQISETNEAKAKRDLIIDEDLRPNTKSSVQQGQSDGAQPTINDNANTKKSEPKVKRINPKGVKGEFDVTLDKNDNVSKIHSSKDGREISKFIMRKVKKTKENPKGLKPVKNGNYSKIESEILGVQTDNQTNEIHREKVKASLDAYTPNDAYSHALDYVARDGNVSLESAKKETGLSSKEVRWATGFKKDINLPSIEAASETIVSNSNQELEMQDIRNALIDIYSRKRGINEVENDIIELVESEQKQIQENESRSYIGSLSEKELSEYNNIKAEDDYISELSDQEALEFYEEQYGKQSEQQGAEQGTFNKERTPKIDSVQELQGETKPNTKTKDLKSILDQGNIKDKLDYLDSLKIDPNNLQSTIPFAPQVWNAFIEALKNGLKTTNSLQKAIKYAIDKLKQDGIDIKDINTVVKKFAKDQNIEIETNSEPTPSLKPKQNQNQSFNKKTNQKSLLTRAVTGNENTKVSDALKKHGLDYEVESQEEAKKRAEAFVKDIGEDAAIEALKSGEIQPGAELAFIYSTVIDLLESKSDKATGKNKEKLENDYAKLQEEIFISFDTKAREFGRFLSALNNVYNSSHYKYNLTKQVENYKARNPQDLDANGNIPADVKKRFEARDVQLKAFEKEIQDLKEKLEQSESQQAIDNIKESIDRDKKNTTQKKLSKSQLKNAATLLRKTKFTKSVKDLANLQSNPLGVVQGIWDGAIETVAKALDTGASIEQAIKKGINQIKSSKWYKDLSEKGKKEVDKRFTEDIKENLAKEDFEVSITSDGEINIPEGLIKKYVSNGIEDIDVLAQTILDEYFTGQDITLREIRDVITGYGKTINPSQDELSEQISKMKNLGKVLSGMEDVSIGERPKRSGYQRRKKTDKERRKERELKEAMRELPIDEGDSETQWKTQLDVVKSRLKNQINDLNDQISNKEKSKPEKQPIEYDQEAKDLVSQRDRLKATLEGIVGKTELTHEQKVKQAERSLERSIEKLEEDIKLNNLAFKEKTPVSSKKIKTLKLKQSDLRTELNNMRKESGLIEKRRLANRKKAVSKRLSELQDKRKNKDYSKKERKVLPEDKELKELQRKYNKEKEKYDQEAYEDELKNMHILKKISKQFVNFLGIQRVLLATGEFSFIFLQNAVPTINLMVRNPKKLGQIIGQTIKSYSKSKYESDYAQLEGHDLFDLAVKSRLALTRTNYKMDAKEESFQSDIITSSFKLLGQSLDFDGKKKLSIYNTILKSLGIDVSNKKKNSISDQIENSNPFSAMERFTTTYGNHIKMDLFSKGIKKLELEGKNPIDNKKDYDRLANAINTLTGRATLGNFDSISPELNAVFFSARFAVSTFNKLNPVYYAVVLRDNENPLKPSVAQKMAISQVATYIATTTAFVLALQTMAGEDEDGDNIIKIENNPTSSDFGKLKIGNIRFDPWGGHLPWVVLFSRMYSGEMKRSNGKVIKLGEGQNDTRFDKIVDFGVGKFNPTLATGVRFLRSHEEIDGVKRDKYGNEVSIQAELEMMYPIYWQGIKEVIAENPEKGKEFAYGMTALGLLGVNNQVYGTSDKSLFKGYSKDVKNEMSTKRGQYLRPNKEDVTSDIDLDKQFEEFKTKHETNYRELLIRIKKETNTLNNKELAESLKSSGFSTDDIRSLAKGIPPKMKMFQRITIKSRLKKIKEQLQKKDEDKYPLIKKDIINKAIHYNKNAEKYNTLSRKRSFNE